MCGPRGLPGARDWLFHNEGDRFVDVTVRAGVRDTAGYYGFAAAWVDVDDDGDLDLLVVNDSTPNYLYRNNGKGTFEEIGFPSGFAVNEEGREQAGMGWRLATTTTMAASTPTSPTSRTIPTRCVETRRWRVRRRHGRAPASARRPSRFSDGAPAFSTTTTMAGSICSWPTVTSIRRWTASTGA